MMIPKETVNLYTSIHAPDSLKQKITEKSDMARPQKSRHPWKTLAATAACLALIFAAAAAFLQPPTAELSLNGTVVESTPITVAMPIPMAARAVPAEVGPMQIPLEVSEEAEISVSLGEVQWEEDNGSDSDSFVWLIPAEALTGSDATLTLTIQEKETTYSLFTDDTATWYLVKAE